ncbi:MAG TPA: sigma-70 family RNA polymerase sigma factor, partial [Kofleriaceae bacterium]|nr:sigma-70 family RNA polymerase sigma factor [Kofleriaceae bacterium]
MTREAPSLAQFAEVVRCHQAVVCAAAFGVTGDRALSEDVAQETFLAAWRGLASLRDPARLPEWLRGIARNLAHKARRKRGPIADSTPLDAPGALDPTTAAIAHDEAHQVWAALAALPAHAREALVLYYWEDLSARQVGAALGISEDAAMQRLSRGRAMLRDALEPRIAAEVRRSRPGAALTAAILAAIAAIAGAP